MLIIFCIKLWQISQITKKKEDCFYEKDFIFAVIGSASDNNAVCRSCYGTNNCTGGNLSHPDHNVIVTTHGYLNPDGSLIVDGMATNEGYNDGDDMWHKFIKKHANITMVLCGHELSENIVAVQSKGENGNIVTQMMINPQVLDHLNSTERPTGMVCMLYFSDGGRKVEVEYYSTVKQQYFKDVNQFNFEVDVVDNNIDGDMDGDGFIGAKDIAEVKKCLLGTVNKAYYYDVTGEGDINILDLIRVKKYAAKVS